MKAGFPTILVIETKMQEATRLSSSELGSGDTQLGRWERDGPKNRTGRSWMDLTTWDQAQCRREARLWSNLVCGRD